MMAENKQIGREVVSRAAMVIFALLLLGGAVGLFYAAWIYLNPPASPDRITRPSIVLPILMGALGVALAGLGLFLLKRAVLPSRVDETPPDVRTGEMDIGPADASWWQLLFRRGR